MSIDTVTDGPSVLLTSEQEDLHAMLRRAFGDWDRARAEEGKVGSDLDPDHWRSLAEDLGLLGVDIPVEHGGEGFSAVELGLTLTEMGRVLLPGPYLSTVVLGAGLLMALGDDRSTSYLPRIATGGLRVALAVDESGHGWDPVGMDTLATPREDGGYTLSGIKRNVVDGAGAEVVFVAARVGEDVGFFAVSPDIGGMEIVEMATIDPSRRLAEVRFDGAGAEAVGTPGNGRAALEAVRDRLYAGLACEAVGAARACLEMTVDYAKTRRQFDRPIGSFQAIKHACADLYVEIEAAESLARYAIASLAGGGPRGEAAAALAAAAAAEALDHAASANVQFHGGIGFTWEHPAHRYYRRATASRLLFGSPGEMRLRAFGSIDDGRGMPAP
jgi:alkylation response protein AidB-like acyl-CoA dehydrogenase